MIFVSAIVSKEKCRGFRVMTLIFCWHKDQAGKFGTSSFDSYTGRYSQSVQNRQCRRCCLLGAKKARQKTRYCTPNIFRLYWRYSPLEMILLEPESSIFFLALYQRFLFSTGGCIPSVYVLHKTSTICLLSLVYNTGSTVFLLSMYFGRCSHFSCSVGLPLTMSTY